MSGFEWAQVRERFSAEARSERPDLALLCLLVGAAADPAAGEDGLDAGQIELDRLAGQVPYRPGGPAAWAEALRELLGERCGFRGSAADYDRLDSSLLDRVLVRRRGLPILLSVVWVEVARRAGAPVYGVALPGHFVAGFGPPEDLGRQVLVDPFDGGRLLTGEDAGLLVTGATGAPLEPSMLTPAEPLDVVMRILNNIRSWAAARPERSDVALWAVELALAVPSHPARLRYERGQLLVRRGDFLGGAAELEEYAGLVEVVDEGTAERVRGEAFAARALLN
ncbi:transglutaminase-like domain-containing protein [Streptomyces sp. AK04-3B]|uniref:transglutaminase-like domain-containing protein n=1 Tax=unclassified Streptomyces TaxID=2593676 RepID=UPI0029B7ADCB|nr:transglutaminase-like domain-containing protein [Streptomyces sp. AK04-3B]MDX3798543.1 transglutaminase-like domain-containing protein [Streptomyces sp. AK04-3B]